ncbi:hypothetical protein EYR40_001168 [Pleurotus pulmonarius]|nr:hypothetical protein EYR38_004409 [Pleurotus pulmonarius]KAF4608815.1 hypothetical protein EYR40_001168 [Pleurotus pulmonarius]
MSPRTLVARQTTSASDGAGTSASTTRTRTRASASPSASATPSSNSTTPSAGLPPASSASASNGGGEVPINVIVGGTLAGMALAIAIIMAWAYFSRALKRRRELESKKAHWLEETKNNTLHNIAPNTPLSMRGAGSLQPASVPVKPSSSRVTFTGRGRKNSSGTNNFNGGGDPEKGHHHQQQRPPGLTPSQPQSIPSASTPSASIPSTSKPSAPTPSTSKPSTSKPQPSLPKPLKPLRPPKRINPDAYGLRLLEQEAGDLQ